MRGRPKTVRDVFEAAENPGSNLATLQSSVSPSFHRTTRGGAKKTQAAKTVPLPPPQSAPPLAASPDTVERGQVVRLIWNTGNANEIFIAGVELPPHEAADAEDTEQR